MASNICLLERGMWIAACILSVLLFPCKNLEDLFLIVPMAGSPQVMYPLMSAVTTQLLYSVDNELGSICLLYSAAEHDIYYVNMQVSLKGKNTCILKKMCCKVNLD